MADPIPTPEPSLPPIVQAIREFQQAARDFYASNPAPGCTPLCPGNCAHRSAER
jgi:hypothetical protein